MSEVFLKILNMSINASWLVLVVLVLRPIFKKAPRWMSCMLWAAVACRLVCPISLESAMSLLPSGEVIPQDITMESEPMIHSKIAIVDDSVNPVLVRNLAPSMEDSVNPLQIVVAVASWVWFAGVVLCLCHAVISYLLLYRKVGASLPAGDGVMLCDMIQTPFILGIFKPLIYVPSSLTGEKLEIVLSHERAHLKRRDHLWKPLGFALLAVYWFHPLCWIAYILLCRDIEAACDEKVISGRDKEFAVNYSQALLDLSLSRRMITVCPLAFGETGVKERVKSVLNYKKPPFWIITVGIVAGILLVVCFATNPKKDLANGEPKQAGGIANQGAGLQDSESKDGARLPEAEVQELMSGADAAFFPEERWYYYTENDAMGEMRNGRYPVYFFIRFQPDGTDYWYETSISSFIGNGNYCILGDELIIADVSYGETDERSIHRFRITGERLVFQEAMSENFLFVKLKDGEEFYWKKDMVLEDGKKYNLDGDANLKVGEESSSEGDAVLTGQQEENLSEEDQAAIKLIRGFVETANAHDLEGYIALFDKENQKEMRRFVEANGEENFFLETSRSILKIERNEQPPYEKNEGVFEDAISYRVTEVVDVWGSTPQTALELQAGEVIHDYVIVKEYGAWKLYRVSAVP